MKNLIKKYEYIKAKFKILSLKGLYKALEKEKEIVYIRNLVIIILLENIL